MSKCIKKLLYLGTVGVLMVSLLLSAITPMTMAEEEGSSSVRVSAKRFMTEEIAAENADIKNNADMSVKLTLRSDSPVMSMRTVAVASNTKANALRIVVRNGSLCSGMKIDYIFKNSAQISESVSVDEISVKPMSDATEYIVYVPSVDTMTQMSIRFFGATSGEIDIVSIGAVSVFYDEREYFGELSENSYDRDLKKATFAGSVSYEMLLKHPNAKIVLYRLAQTEVIEDVRFVHPYVSACEMTLNYKFEFNIESTSEYCSRYFAAILTEGNKIIPLTSETYLKEDRSHHNNNDEKNDINTGFKGIETDLYVGAVENGTSVAFVDVRLDRMENESGDGYQYILDEGKEYYFDRSYILALDEEIKSLSSSGIYVYLRLLLDSPSPVFGHIKKYVIPDKTKYFAIDPQNDETVDNIFAYTDFICSRYADMAGSGFKGIVLGRSLDKSLEYNYCGAVSMNQYADMLAKTYSIIKAALDRSDADTEVIIPLSDDKIGTEVILTLESREEDYPADILVRSFLSSLERYGSDVSSISFMLESEGVPDLWTGNNALVGKMTSDNCGDFTEMVKKLSAQYKDLSEEIIFCWFPSESLSTSELLNVYAYNYNFLSCINGIKSYIVSIFEMEEQSNLSGMSRSLEEQIFSTIKSTYKYIDTDNNERVCFPALEAAGKNSWSELVDGYSVEKTVKRELFEKEITYSMPEGISGSYKMWDFSTANGTGDWGRSDGCTSLSVYTHAGNSSRSLVATLGLDGIDMKGADYGGIVYHAPESLLMRDISAVSFEIFIPQGVYGDIFDIRISVEADKVLTESSGIVKAGEHITVYSDISELDEVKCIKIGVRNLSGTTEAPVDVCIDSISIHSRKYNSEELESIVVSGDIVNKKEENKDKPEKNEGYASVAVVLIVSLAVVGSFWVCSVLLRKNKKR